MSRSKKKIYGAVLVIGLGVVVVDRLTSGGPKSAVAASQPQANENIAVDPRSSPTTSPTKPTSDKEKKPPKEVVLFPQKLPEVDWAQAARNPFALPDLLAGRRNSRLSGSDKKDATGIIRRAGDSLSSAHFLQMHTLQGISSGETPSVIIDGQLVRVGQKFDESVLLKVDGGKAYFQCLDGVAEMSINLTPKPQTKP